MYFLLQVAHFVTSVFLMQNQVLLTLDGLRAVHVEGTLNTLVHFPLPCDKNVVNVVYKVSFLTTLF